MTSFNTMTLRGMMSMTLVPLLLVVAASETLSKYDTRWFEVPLDHFDFSKKDTMKIKYLVDASRFNKRTVKGDLPTMIFYTGNEGPIELFYRNSGFATESLPDMFNAVVVFAEHRFFGDSWPKPQGKEGETVPWRYCSVEQVLRDYATLIDSLEQSEEFGTRFNVIAVGGSYGGMLSAWFRQHYPSTVFAALAASAPLLQYVNMTDYSAFFRRVSDNFIHAGCGEILREAVAMTTPWTKEQEAKKAAFKDIKEGLNLCESPDSEEEIRANIVGWWKETMTTLSMVNYPMPSSFVLPVTKGYPIEAFCQAVKAQHSSNPSMRSRVSNAKHIFEALRSGLESIGLINPGDCFNATVDDDVDKLDNEVLRWRVMTSRLFGDEMSSNTPSMAKLRERLRATAQSFDDVRAPLGNLLGWTYLVCTTQVMPMVTTGKSDIFPPQGYSFERNRKNCADIFGNELERSANYAWPRMYEQGFHQCDRIIFSTGDVDPWDTGSFHNSPSDTCPVVKIQGGAHHYDLRLPDREKRDTESVKAARLLEIETLQDWLEQGSVGAKASPEKEKVRVVSER